MLAAILAGIHHGIAEKLDPPARWEAAVDAFDAAKVLPKYLGKRYHALYASCRREECDRVHAEITDRDYEWYLRAI